MFSPSKTMPVKNCIGASSPVWYSNTDAMIPEQNSASGMNRRQFLFVTAATLVTGCQGMHGAGNGSALASHERVINAGPISNYAADGLYEGFRDFGFFVVRKGNELTVYSSYCTHRKCKLSAEADHSFSCPCHGSTFTPDGK